MFKKVIKTAILVNLVFILVSTMTLGDSRYEQAATADNTTTYSVGATAPWFLEINSQLKYFVYNETLGASDIDWDSSPSSLDFGDLVEATDSSDNGLGWMTGENAYAVVMAPVTSGREYRILFTGGPLTGASGTIGTGSDAGEGSTQDAYLVVPDYQHLDLIYTSDDLNITQGAPPSGATVRPVARAGSASDYEIYTSGTAGLSRIVRAYLGIGGPPDVGVNVSSCTQGHNAGTCVGTEQVFSPGSIWDIVTKNQPGGAYSGSVTFTLDLT